MAFSAHWARQKLLHDVCVLDLHDSSEQLAPNEALLCAPLVILIFPSFHLHSQSAAAQPVLKVDSVRRTRHFLALDRAVRMISTSMTIAIMMRKSFSHWERARQFIHLKVS